jgi:peroxiredoxin
MDKVLGTITVTAALASGAGGCQSHGTSVEKETSPPQLVAADAKTVHPLSEGAPAPNVVLAGADGRPVNMASLYAAKPSILIFYRGGWCPYCNMHLGQIAKAEPELVAMGYQILAISPDKPEAAHATMDKGGYTYQLLSDSDMVLSKAFGLAFKVDDPTLAQYRGFGIDLDQASGRSHHLLPVPAVYIVDTKGTIRFAHWNPDYKTRLQPQELLDAAQRVKDR